MNCLIKRFEHNLTHYKSCFSAKKKYIYIENDDHNYHVTFSYEKMKQRYKSLTKQLAVINFDLTMMITRYNIFTEDGTTNRLID